MDNAQQTSGNCTNELRTAIRIIHSGQQHIPSYVGAKLVERMNNPVLADRELKVLQLIV